MPRGRHAGPQLIPVRTRSASHAAGPARWPRVAILLHAVTAGLALATALYGLWLLSPPEWSAPYVARYMAGIPFHKAGGIAAFAFALAWGGTRLSLGRPPRPGGAWTQGIARVVHGALVLLLLALPVTGYLADTLSGSALLLPGGIMVPRVLPADPAWSIAFSYCHKWGGFALLALAGLHLAGAARHFLAARIAAARPAANEPGAD